MTETERSLLDTVLENPDDDLPRLVYADYLDENGDPKRAEFIRAQIALVPIFDRQLFDNSEYASITKQLVQLGPQEFRSFLTRSGFHPAENELLLVDTFKDAMRIRNSVRNVVFHYRRGHIETITAPWEFIVELSDAIFHCPVRTLYSFHEGERGGIRIQIDRRNDGWHSYILVDFVNRVGCKSKERHWANRIQLRTTVLSWALEEHRKMKTKHTR